MSIQKIVAELIAGSVVKKIENDAHGVILMDLPGYSYNIFLDMVLSKVNEKGLLKPYIFFVGFTSEEREELKSSLRKDLDINIYYSVEEAEKFRHDKDVYSTRIVIVKRYVPKLSSLLWFEKVEVKEL